tara:strand:+ start:16364 stop:17404 length:1041 start_codon:yes stop_codon:yes gene_type:complete
MENLIIKKLIVWYSINSRDLPWRKLYRNNLPKPYNIFVSEFMLQQTTVGTVKKRFKEFINLWPNMSSLSKISNSKILSFWSGLGYYRRATNLLSSAKEINKLYNNKIPKNYDNLTKLPGIGEYTAKAILGIAFNEPVLPLDTNIERILSRLYALGGPIVKVKKNLRLKAELFSDKKNQSILIQAFMDYGSIICTPKNPNCLNCIINKYCKSYKSNQQNLIPYKSSIKTKKRKKFTRAYIFINEKNEILIRKRNSNGMLASMLEVPNDNWVENRKNLVFDSVANKFKKKIIQKGFVNYPFSHFDLNIEVFYTKVKKNLFQEYKWINIHKINNSALPTVMKKIIEIAF